MRRVRAGDACLKTENFKLKTRSGARILIVDGQVIVRKGLKQILSETFKRVMFGEAADADEAVEQIRQATWDVVLLDLTMPAKSGLRVLEQVIAAQPGLAVLVLSTHPEDQYAVRVLKVGAAGYIVKSRAADDVVTAVQKVLGGGKYIGASLAEKLADNLNTPVAQSPHDKLSEREFQVMRLIAQGRRVKEIGSELSLSVKTVSTYRVRVLEKMNLKTNAELIRYAVRERLVD
jgi:DNA-binding NarL/FixJ family response regulator